MLSKFKLSNILFIVLCLLMALSNWIAKLEVLFYLFLILAIIETALVIWETPRPRPKPKPLKPIEFYYLIYQRANQANIYIGLSAQEIEHRIKILGLQPRQFSIIRGKNVTEQICK